LHLKNLLVTRDAHDHRTKQAACHPIKFYESMSYRAQSAAPSDRNCHSVTRAANAIWGTAGCSPAIWFSEICKWTSHGSR
jgi:hypothetical protein